MGTKRKVDEQPSAIPNADVDDFAARIRTAWHKSAEGIIEAGRLLTEAKEALRHGRFGRLFKEKKVPFSERVAQCLMEVARNPVLTNPNHSSDLPPHWRTLYELTRIPEPQLQEMMAEGRVYPEMERKEVERLAKPLRPKRLFDALSDLSVFQRTWPDPASMVP